MVYFASDVHLGCGDPSVAQRVERQFLAWLDRIEVDARAVCLAGDIFDFWFEKKGRIPDGYDRVLLRLRELTARGIEVLFFTGNHDMWLGGYFERVCGMRVFTGPQLLEFYGVRVLVAHGDNLNIADKPLLRLLNAFFRSKCARRVFEWLTPYRGILWIGRRWSAASRRSGGEKSYSEAVTEPLVEWARGYAAAHRVDCFVFGHMHWARDCRCEGLHTVHLGCWEQRPTYAVLEPSGRLTLKQFDEP